VTSELAFGALITPAACTTMSSKVTSEFQTTNACVTVSLGGVIYGDSSTALFRRGGDEGNFSRAAAKVYVAQPSLSQQIRSWRKSANRCLIVCRDQSS
jgi:hypothetical protein